MLNPQSSPQTIRITAFGAQNVTKTVTLRARTRDAFHLDTWGLTGAFGVEVVCGGTCAASLVMWDPAYTSPNVSAPVVACEAR